MKTEEILTYLIWWAAFTQFMVMISGLIAPTKLNYRKSIVKMELFHGQVFKVYSFYILFILFSMTLACVFYTDDFIFSEGLGRGFVVFYAIFWTIRLYNQLFYYNKAIKRKYPIYNFIFTVAFIYLSGLFLSLAIFF